MSRKVDLEEGLDAALIAQWFAEEDARLLLELDPAAVLGQPPTSTGASAWTSALEGSGCPDGSEVLQMRRAMIRSESQQVGFAVFALVRRPSSEARGCRICHEDDGHEELLENCCGCRGSMSYIHGSCLAMEWKAKGKPEVMLCSLCHQPFVGKAAGLLAKEVAAKVDRRRAEEKPLPCPPQEQKRQEELLVAQISSATALWRDGQLSEAATSFRSTLGSLQELLGECSSKTLTARHNLGLVLQAQDKIDEAWEHIHKAAAGFAELLGEHHALTLKALHNEALIAQKRGKLEEAETGYSKVLQTRREVLGENHVDTLKTAGNLGLVIYQRQRPSEAAPLLRETMQGLVHVLGRQHPLTLTVMQNLSLAMAGEQPGSEEALRLGREAAEGKQLALGAENLETLEGWRDLATLFVQAGRLEQAEGFLRHALAGQEKRLGFGSLAVKVTLRKLEEVLRKRGNDEEAQKLCQQHLDGIAAEVTEPLPKPTQRGPIVVVGLVLYVLPEFRRRGIGRAIVDLWKEFGRAHSATAVEVDLLPSAASLGFFAKGVGMVSLPETGEETGGFERKKRRLHYAL